MRLAHPVKGYPASYGFTTGRTPSLHPKLFSRTAHKQGASLYNGVLMTDGLTAGLLEREDELRQLDRLLDDACAGRGRMVLFEGPPGIGKTRLLEAGRALARERGMVVLSARASELDRDFPFGVVRQLFEPLIASAEPERRSALLQGATRLTTLLGAGAPEPGPADGDPSLARFHALYLLTASLADAGPVALAVDDVHWADSSSLRFLQFLLPRLDELPVLVALASRPAETEADRQPIDALATDALTVVLRPAPLSDEAVAALVAADLGEGADADFCAACRSATGGNPFLLRELLHDLKQEEVTPTAARVSLVRRIAPPTVARAVLVRLTRLGGDATSLARAVAILGDGTPLRRACALAGLPEERAEGLAAALARADILMGSRPLAFAHPIMRAAVYADVDAGERVRGHQRAAALLAGDGAGAEAVAVHLLVTEPACDPDVVATLRAAAAGALAGGAAPTAVACLRRALAEPPPASERGHVTLELASAELHAGEPARAVEHFEEGVAAVDDPRVRATAASEQSVALQAVGRAEDARRLMEHLIEDLAEVDLELALSMEASLISSSILRRARRGWARERLERYRGRLSVETTGERKLLATLVQFDAFSGHEPAEALADQAARALEGGLFDPSSGRTTPFYSAINVLLLADRVEPARRALDLAADDARRRGSSPWLLAG
ncbi:MAG: hypothetical protein QOF55_2254, partial [Thermoleophilaceae bacterium]|nr:hypothetical protein [Thermoleophilaceae bacterium]